MNNTEQSATEVAIQEVDATDQLTVKSTSVKLFSILGTLIVTTIGLAIGGIIGLFIAFYTGLIRILC
jgi:hypothetical protein